jgi:hypothetical protein
VTLPPSLPRQQRLKILVEEILVEDSDEYESAEVCEHDLQSVVILKEDIDVPESVSGSSVGPLVSSVSHCIVSQVKLIFFGLLVTPYRLRKKTSGTTIMSSMELHLRHLL